MSKENFSKIIENLPVFFMRANSSKGFKSYFHKLSDVDNGERMYIIKGGPGTGKSTLMKNILENMIEIGEEAEVILCSTDMNSLDGVVFPELGVSIIDGTPPHTVEPKYPGAVERVIQLSEYFDNNALEENSKEIISLCKINTLLHKNASNLIKGAGDLLNDNLSIDIAHSNLKEVSSAAKEVAGLFFDKKRTKRGEEKIRFLSGVTAKGVESLYDKVKIYADKIILIEDELGAVSSVFLATIRRFAIDNGYDVISCPCALFPEQKIDHIIIPEKRLAFCTTNSFLKSPKEYTKNIHSNRFRNLLEIERFKERIKFNQNASKELLKTASSLISDAKTVHDIIEKYYIDAMNFDGVKYYTNEILKTLK